MPFTNPNQVPRDVDLTGIRDIYANIYVNGMKYLTEFKSDLETNEWPTPEVVDSADVTAFNTLKGELKTALETAVEKVSAMVSFLKSGS